MKIKFLQWGKGMGIGVALGLALFMLAGFVPPQTAQQIEFLSVTRVRRLMEGGTNGQVLESQGTGTPHWTSLAGFGVTTFADKTIPYASATDTFSFDSTNFIWDDTANASFLQVGSGTGPGAIKFLEGSGTGTNKATLTIPTSIADITITTPGVTATLASLAGTETLTNKTLTSPVINTAVGSGGTFTGTLKTSSAATGAFGYATGAGGTGTQGTDKSTTVVMSPNPCNCGTITMNAAALAAGTTGTTGVVTFTVTDSGVAVTDYIAIQHVSGGTVGDYGVQAVAGSGNFAVTVRNNSGGSLSEATVLRFVVMGAPTT